MIIPFYYFYDYDSDCYCYDCYNAFTFSITFTITIITAILLQLLLLLLLLLPLLLVLLLLSLLLFLLVSQQQRLVVGNFVSWFLVPDQIALYPAGFSSITLQIDGQSPPD